MDALLWMGEYIVQEWLFCIKPMRVCGLGSRQRRLYGHPRSLADGELFTITSLLIINNLFIINVSKILLRGLTVTTLLQLCALGRYLE